jgi:hypothetical protein
MTHNLDIQKYSFDELLAIFNIHLGETISHEDMKRAKKKVLMLHPDKSRLGPEYFLFYKKAYDIVLQFYQNQDRQNQQVVKKTYEPASMTESKTLDHQIRAKISEMNTAAFHEKFNQIFEETNGKSRRDSNRNEWFAQEQGFQTVRQQAGHLVRYTGVQDLQLSSGTSLYDDEDDATDQYIAVDPFSRLKFDDLRKVHKDQTVFAVSEADFAAKKTFGSVEEYNKERGRYSYDPLEKDHAEHLLQKQQRAYREQMMRKEYQAKLQTEQYAEKNKGVLATFLQLR